jgi:transglutaminase-like putative cysteine protease
VVLKTPWAERLAHLPRDSRDTLFLLLVIAWTIAPHLLHLPPWCGAMAACLLAWRARLALRGGALPGRWTITALLFAAAGLTWWDQHTLLGKEAGITMLVVLMALKTLELRARRDALVVFFLGFFLVLTHFLYSQSLGTGLWLVLSVWALLTALVLAHMPVGRPDLVQAGAVAARAAAWGLPLMLTLFLLFPRIGPLWGLPQDASARTGLSGSMRLGAVASIAEDEAIALRIRFIGGPPPAPEALYFRGPVLGQFDGREWTRTVPSVPAAQRPRLELQVRGAAVRYEVTIEASRNNLVPLLEMTPEDERTAPALEGWLLSLRSDGQWQADRPINERIRLQASAWLDHRHGPHQAVPGLRDLLALPPGSSPRTQQWATELRQRPELAAAGPRQLAEAVLQHIARGGYTYTLEPGSYEADADPLDAFWMDRKLGFCEHFASAFVVVMRALGVPARIVTGYQGTDPLPQDGWWIVRQRNAHAWAEIWLPDIGWQRVDPTAAVAPDRVQRGRSLAAPPGFVAGAIGSLNPALATQLRRLWEGVDNRWNQWVLNYSRGQQFDLLRSLGVTAPDWQDLASVLIGLLCTGSLAGAVWAWRDRHRQDPWLRLQTKIQRRLLQLGVSVRPHDPPRSRAARVRAVLGVHGEALAELLDRLDRERYAATQPTSGVPRGWWRAFAAAARTVPQSLDRRAVIGVSSP